MDLGFFSFLTAFSRKYHCYSITCAPGARPDMESGGKIIMPPSALDTLARSNISYPMVFKLKNPHYDHATHCGVLEFTATEGFIYVPHWMMQNILAEEGAVVFVDYVNLPVATYAKFQPCSSDFFNLYNPKAVLEMLLRSYSCLTKDDYIIVQYNDKVYDIRVVELHPADAVTIIDCDVSVDFAEALDSQTVAATPSNVVSPEHECDDNETDPPVAVTDEGFIPFAGEGLRLDGKVCMNAPTSFADNNSQKKNSQRGIPDYNYKPGRLLFLRNANINKAKEADSSESKFVPFSTEGRKLRPSQTYGR